MRIILVNKFWFLQGGAERVVFATKKLLETAGHQVEIFGMKNEKNIMQNKYFIDEVDYHNTKGLKKIKVAKDFIYNNQAKRNFKSLIKDFQPDVIHFHNIYHQLSFSLVDVALAENIPTVMTLHDYKMISPNYNLFHHGKIGEECLKGRYYNCLLKNCLENWLWSFVATVEAYFRKFKKFDKYINLYLSPSKFLKDKFVDNGFSAQKIRVLPNPLDCFVALAPRNDNGVNNNTTQSAIEMDVVSASRQETIGESILYFGRLSIEKGVHILLQTAKLTPNINYRIAGVGPEKNNLEKYVKDNNLKNVVFLGFLEKEKLATEITEARLIVVPSIWYEVFGLNITESMIKGKVVLGANIGAISEILPPELLFLPNNPHDLAEMIKIWYNKPFAELENMGQKLKLQAEKIGNPDKYLADLLAIYAKIQTEKL